MTWPTAALREVCEINVGRTPSRSRPEYWGPSTPWLSIADMNQGRDLSTTKETITDLAVEGAAAKLVSIGTVLLSFKLSIGKVGIARRPMFTNEAIAALPVRDPSRLLPEYLCWALASMDLVGGANRAAMGATLNKAKLQQLMIPLPPMEEQRRIAAILDQADALRAKRREALAHLDDLTQSIFLDMFGDPVTNTREWRVMAFGDVCQTRLGKMLDAKQQTGNHVRAYLRNANVQWFNFDLDDVLTMDFDPAARELFRLRDGDLLICEGGRPGRSAIWRGELEECYYQKALHRARPLRDRATPEYLAFMLWIFVERGALDDHISSATIAHLTSERLKAMPVPVPPLAMQSAFADRVAEIERVRAVGQAHSVELDGLFASLQARAFAGEL